MFSFRAHVSAGKASAFEAKFCPAVIDVGGWVRENLDLRYDGHIRVDVFPSDRPEASMALLPAWRGDRGRIRFSSYRVHHGNAAITHELVHVFAPNQNRFLAEGLAVFAQWELHPQEHVYPNFGTPLHEAARASVELADLAYLDSIATPSRLTYATLRSPAEERRAYIDAGSFVQFLIGRYGSAKFRALYEMTPLTPGRMGDGGDPDRWQNVYGKSVSALQNEWAAHIGSVH